MKNLINITVNSLIISAVIVSEEQGIESAYNLAIFSLWALVVIGLIILFVDEKELFKDAKKSYISSWMGLIIILTLVYYGWFYTAIAFSIVECLLWAKKYSYFGNKELTQ